jgi:hypothetical protein
MMGRQSKVQKKLFYTKFNLDQRVPKNHILREGVRSLNLTILRYLYFLTLKLSNLKI